MINRIWHGWTAPENADLYEALLKKKYLWEFMIEILMALEVFNLCVEKQGMKLNLSRSCYLIRLTLSGSLPGRIMKQRLFRQRQENYYPTLMKGPNIIR